MDPGQLFQGLQLDNHLAFNQQVSTESFVKNQLVVADLDWHLAFDAQALFAQLMGQGYFVHRFQQARPGFCVDLERGVKDDFGQLIFSERVR